MSIPKGQRRGVRRRGKSTPRMPGFLREDLLNYFAGVKPGHGWLFLIWHYEQHFPEACRLWNDYLAEHPDAKLPRLLAERLMAKHIAHRGDLPDENTPDPENLDLVREAAGMTVESVQAAIAERAKE